MDLDLRYRMSSTKLAVGLDLMFHMVDTVAP